MTAKERLIKSIEEELREAKIESIEFSDDKSLYAFIQGRIFAHSYDLLVIDRILSEEGKKGTE